MNYEKLLKEKVFKTYEFTAELCRQHNLRFYACGGTMLGAVRHHDMIPWDDDIDIYMPRNDYEKFLELRESVKEDGYDMVSISDEGYYLPYAKLIDTTTTLWEYPQYSCLIGVFIDIFPLDTYECSDIDIYRHQIKCRNAFSRYVMMGESNVWQMLKRHISRYHLKRAAILLLGKFVGLFLRKHQLRKFFYLSSELTCDDGTKCVCNTQWEGKIFKTEWFDDCIDMSFGSTTIPVPRQYDEYLTLLYGDYMQLPPKNQRVSQHFREYLNLRERLTMKEVKKRIAQGKRIEY